MLFFNHENLYAKYDKKEKKNGDIDFFFFNIDFMSLVRKS